MKKTKQDKLEKYLKKIAKIIGAKNPEAIEDITLNIVRDRNNVADITIDFRLFFSGE